MSSWHVMLTTPLGESCAAAGLVGRGFDVLAPEIKRRVRHGRGKVIDRSYAMFPGYIFVDCSAADYLRIRHVPRIRDFLRSEGTPVTVSQNAVYAIRDKELELDRKRIARLKLKYEHDFRPGQQIEVVEGPFAPLLAKIDQLDSHGRIVLLYKMLGRAVRITLDAPQIRAA